MKKKWLCLSVIGALLLAGCGQETPPPAGSGEPKKPDGAVQQLPEDTLDAQKIVTDFFASPYAYEITTEEHLGDDPGAPAPAAAEGKIIPSPYREYQMIDDIEIFYEGDGELVTVMTRRGVNWVRTEEYRSYHFGFGQKDMTFTEISRQETTGQSSRVFAASYTETLTSLDNEDLSLTAEISQMYFIDPDTEQVIRIETDLSDYTQKRLMLIDMADNGTSEADAAAKVADISKKEIMNITAYGDDVVIDPMPEAE